ncbi:hypothetical protein V9K67_20450 [Paraflavisolibacter sp. H34]|uniref:hypothetical protein n=1 Tax=Huijunlia imazamoxiresistens TaxID=3127457 RepID=UPI003015CA20
MDNQVTRSNFELPQWDAKKTWGTVMTLIILGGLAVLFYIYVLPFLLSVVWGTIQLVVGIAVAIVLLMILTNPKFWRGMRYFSEALAQGVLGWAIEMNPWNILNLQIEEAEKDREQLRIHGEKLKAQAASLQLQLEENERNLRLAQEEVKLCKTRLEKQPDDFDTQLALETSATNFSNAKDFIDAVKPVANDVKNLVVFADKAYRKSGVALMNSKNTVKIQKAKYDAVTTASATMAKAMKAFTGNTDLNTDADKAIQKIRQDVAAKIGGIKSAIQITSQAMNAQDLKDAAKVSIAAQTATRLDVDKTFSYADSIQSSAAQIDDSDKANSGNKYLDLFNKQGQ